MQKRLEQALDRAEYIIESARQRPPKRPQSASGEKSLREKLYDIYVEECEKEPEFTEHLIRNVNLLEKLLKRETLSCLVVNLYPGNEGYSLMLKGQDETYLETIQLPYEEREFLEYLDAQELPPVLVDVLERSELKMFHRGCVIVEVRDYRQRSSEPPGYQSRHTLLRPTMQTLVSDVQSIARDHPEWTEEDKLLLESQMILATAEPLCLDPCVSVACTENRLLFNRQKMNAPSIKRNLKRYSTASLNEQQELSSTPPPHKRSEESQAAQQADPQIFEAGKHVDTWIQELCDLEALSELDVEQYVTEERPFEYDDSLPTGWPAQGAKDDDPFFGYDTGDQPQTTAVAFMQSMNDPLISGKGRSPERARQGRQMPPFHSWTNDHSYSFLPKSNLNTGEVVSLFEELMHERSERPFEVSQGCSDSASVSRVSPGREAEQLAAGQLSLEQLAAGQLSLEQPAAGQLSLEQLAAGQLSPEQPAGGPLSAGREAKQPQAMAGQSSVPGEGMQSSPPPGNLPSSSGNSSLGNMCVTPQQTVCFPVPMLPSPAPALKPPSFAQRSSVEGSHTNMPTVMTLGPASHTQTTSASQVEVRAAGPKVFHVVDPLTLVQTVVSSPNPRQGRTAQARAPVHAEPSPSPSRGRGRGRGRGQGRGRGRGQPAGARPTVPPAAPQEGIQYNLGNLSGFKPVGLLWVPEGVDLWKTQQPQQVLCQYLPGLQLQLTHPSQQPVWQISSVQALAQPRAQPPAQPPVQPPVQLQTTLSAQHSVVNNYNGVTSVVQAPIMVEHQPGTAQTTWAQLFPTEHPALLCFPEPAAAAAAAAAPATAAAPAAAAATAGKDPILPYVVAAAAQPTEPAGGPQSGGPSGPPRS